EVLSLREPGGNGTARDEARWQVLHLAIRCVVALALLDERAKPAVRDRTLDATANLLQTQVEHVAAGIEHALVGETFADRAEHPARDAEGPRTAKTHRLPRLNRSAHAASCAREDPALNGIQTIPQQLGDTLFRHGTVDRRRAVRECSLQHVEEHARVRAQIRLLE